MGSAPDSSKALNELRRILLEPEALADAVEPVVDGLLRERSAEIANALMEELTPAIRLAIHEALHEEVRRLSSRHVDHLALAIEASIVQVFRQRIAAPQAERPAALPSPTRTVEEHASKPLADLPIEPLYHDEGVTSPEAGTDEVKTAQGRKPKRQTGWRRFLGLFMSVTGITMGLILLPAIPALSGLKEQAAGARITNTLGGNIVGRAMAYPALTPVGGVAGIPSQTATASGAPSPSGAPDAVLFTGTPSAEPTIHTQTTIPRPSPPPAGSVTATIPLPSPTSAQKAITVVDASPTATSLPTADEEKVTPTSEEETLTNPTPPATALPVADGEPETLPSSEPARADEKVLYLTFDDGPNPTWTPQILELLKQHGAQATFFVIGQQAAKYPDLVLAEVAAGHVVGHHTWSHRTLGGIDRAGFEAEIQQTLATPAGNVISPILRPPYGTIDDDARAWAAELGLQIVTWSLDSKDYQPDSTAEGISSLVISRARPGKVVLLHDGGGNRSGTVAAVQTILETLGQEGYVFRSLPQG